MMMDAPRARSRSGPRRPPCRSPPASVPSRTRRSSPRPHPRSVSSSRPRGPPGAREARGSGEAPPVSDPRRFASPCRDPETTCSPRCPRARAGNDDGAAVDRTSRFRAQPTSPPRRGGGFTPNGRAAETAQRGERRARAPRRHAGCAFGENAEPDAWLARGGGKRRRHRPVRHRDARAEPGSRFPSARRIPSRSLRDSLASPCTRARQCGRGPRTTLNVYFGAFAQRRVPPQHWRSIRYALLSILLFLRLDRIP